MSNHQVAANGLTLRQRSRFMLAAVAVASMLAATFTFMSPADASHNGFHVSGTNLVDANGNTFVMRGTTHPHVWFPDQTSSISDISNLGADTIRIVLGSGHRDWGFSSEADVADVVADCKANQVVCVLEVHDTTGFGDKRDAASLAEAVEYWNSIKGALIGEERYVLINIGNEPYGNRNASEWTQATIDAVQQMRAHGFTHTLVVDAPNWGQDWENIMRTNAPQIFAADSQSNTVFSIHMYEVYGSPSTVIEYFDAFQQMGLPLIVGEFGDKHNGRSVAWETIMEEAESRGIGWIAWSWSGNGGRARNLDQVNDFDPNSLTQWGEKVFNSQYGIGNTAQRASIF